MTAMTTCPSCRGSVSPEDSFCVACGHHLRPFAPPTLAPPPPPPGAVPPPPPVPAPSVQTVPVPTVPGAPALSGDGPSGDRSSRRWMLLGALIGVAAVVALAMVVLSLRSGGSPSSDGSLAPAPVSSAAPATSAASSTVAPTTVAPTTVATTVTTSAPSTTLPFGLPAVFPSSVPPEACTDARIIADTGQTLGFDTFCRGGWSTNVPSAECGEIECEGLTVFRWTGERWVDRGYFYAYCVSTLTASGMPPAIAREVGFDASGGCAVEIDLRPEASVGPLSWNDEGPRVQRLQQALIDRGLLFDEADGQYGPNTQAAVIDLQFFLGVEPDGMAGAEVHAALLLPYD